MATPPPNPPLRVRATGDGNFIPVFEIELSGGTLTRTSSTAVKYEPPGTSSGAPSNATYVTLTADATLTQEHILTAGNSITIATDATTVTISATTTGPHTLDSATHTDVSAVTENTGVLLVVNSASNWVGIGTGVTGQLLQYSGGAGETQVVWADSLDVIDTHTLDSSTHTDVAAVTENTGVLLVVNSASTWVGINTGVTGQVLQYSGGAGETQVVWTNTLDIIDTHTLDSSTHTDVAAVTENTGVLLVVDSSNTWVGIDTGTTGQFLQYSGGAGATQVVWTNTLDVIDTHTLDSTTHTDVAAVTENTGVLLVVDSSNTWVGASTGVTGQMLVVSNGATSYNLIWLDTSGVHATYVQFNSNNLTSGGSGTFIFSHNLAQQYPLVQLFDSSNRLTFSDEITMNTTSSMEVDLTSRGVITGTWKISSVG